ncbi:MAG: Asp23/Gls24 family envelope stress response protein [Gaiellaceae bacterium MAG52_C11]|nr:Asp23/Gls24 family envelope stress response protein [Candidatus Gaiellasilicea maunaloa]
MSHDGHTIEGASGSIRISGDALAGLVATAAELVDGTRVRRPRRGLDVTVKDGHVHVTVEVAARYGAVLPELGAAVQRSVTETLRVATELEVDGVDVAIEELDR